MAATAIDRATGLASSAAFKAPVYVATTANIALSGLLTIDGVALTAGKRVLVKDQSVPAQNGIYIAAASDWQRAPDLTSNDSVREGTRVFVTDGATQAGTEYVVTAADPISIGTTSMTWVTSSAVGSAIHNATADTISDADEVGFYETIAGALRKITWANIKATLSTSLGALIAAMTAKTAVIAADSLVINDSAAANASKQVALADLYARASVLQPPTGPVNMSLAASVGSNALTISLKGADGTAPSATNPVLIPFRSATDATGTLTVLAITAAASLVVSWGSTLGTLSGKRHRLWVVGINDGSTFRLGVVNALSGINVKSFPMSGLLSSTAEGAAGTADSAQTFYTGAAVASKPYVVLGYIEASQVTAGYWASAPLLIKCQQPGDPLPGSIISTVMSETGALATGTTVTPNDDTIPQVGEGDQYMSQAITPLSECSLLDVRACAFLTNSAGAYVTAALHRDAGANALAAGQSGNSVGTTMQVDIRHREKSDTVASTTFTIRGGNSVAGTTTFNGSAGARRMGGVMNSYIQINEIMG